jgi:hypothetical protein
MRLHTAALFRSEGSPGIFGPRMKQRQYIHMRWMRPRKGANTQGLIMTGSESLSNDHEKQTVRGPETHCLACGSPNP